MSDDLSKELNDIETAEEPKVVEEATKSSEEIAAEVATESAKTEAAIKDEDPPDDAAAPTPEPTPDNGDKPLPPALAERAAALQQLTKELTDEIQKFKSGQSYLDGDVPVYLDTLGGSGIGPTDRRIAWIDKRHLDSRYAFRWANKQMIDYHRAKGRWDVKKSDFDLMVKARGGRYSFGSNQEGQVICGDLVLMATTQEHNERLKSKVRAKTASSEGRARGNLRKLGEKLGVEVTADDDVGPKVQAIIKTIAQELGPDALKVFQGQTR